MSGMEAVAKAFEKELGISDNHEEIIILPAEAPVGTPLADYLGDVILDLEVTPNRPDCLSVTGIAREIAALTGAFLTCAQEGVPVLVDGFIASVAALAATRINPDALSWFLFGHRSAEPGHQRVLEALEARPFLDLDMRLGEGSGAAVALSVARLAVELHNGMATFAEAGVSES